MNDHKIDEFTQALIDDQATFEEINRRIEIARHALIRMAKESPNTWNYLCKNSDINYTLIDALETLGNTAYQLSLEEKARFLDTPESQPKPNPITQLRRITWKTKLEDFFVNVTYSTLTISALLGCSWLGSWGLSQARPDIPEFEITANYSKGLAITSFSAFLMSCIGGGVVAGLIDMEIKEND